MYKSAVGIWYVYLICQIYQLFRSLVYFILSFIDLWNFSYRKKLSHQEVDAS